MNRDSGNSEESSGTFSTLLPKKLRKFCNVSLKNLNLKSWLQKCETDSYKAPPHSTNGIRRSNEEEEITVTTNIEKGELRVYMDNRSINLFAPIYQATLSRLQIIEHVSLKGTKIAIIIKNVINESIMLKSEEMLQYKYFSLTNDYTDTADSRTLCVLERHVNEGKIQTYLLDLIRIRDGTQENLYECLEHILQKHDLSLKNIFGMCVNNTIVMLERENSLVRSVQTNEETIVIPWICGIWNDHLPDDIEKLLQLVSIYLRSPKRRAILENIQKLMQEEQNKILEPHMTRWLKCMKRSLQQWIALYSIFAEVNVEDESKIAELMLAFS